MERVSHACILTGAGQEALFDAARERAAALLCEQPRGGSPCRTCRHCRKVLAGIHPDVTVVERRQDREGKLRREIVVDQIRALGADAAVLPNEAEGKVYILRDAETMNESAQNAFLKLLEEPPSFVTFLLCAENPAQLLPTVRSRCAELRVTGEAGVLPEIALRRAEAYLDVLGDDAKQLQCCALLEKLGAAELREFVEALRLSAPERIRDPGELLALERELEKLALWLRVNVGVKQVLAMLATYRMGNLT